MWGEWKMLWLCQYFHELKVDNVEHKFQITTMINEKKFNNSQ